MALVDYGSSDSEAEQSRPPVLPKNKTTTSNKPAFGKLVDKSNTGKIRVSLPSEAVDKTTEENNDGSEPAAKRAKTGPGSFGGFNSFLPAPKRAAPALGKGVNLKTGTAPGFTREPMLETSTYDAGSEENHQPMIDTSAHTEAGNMRSDASGSTQTVSTNELPKKKATIFKPLSVARRPQKKRPALADGQISTASMSKAELSQPTAAPKVSLFSVGNVSETVNTLPTSTGAYQPLIYQPYDRDESKLTSEPKWDQPQSLGDAVPQPVSDTSNQPDSLDSIATDLKLSASARRQLLGRNQRDSRTSSIKITNFNTDQEYAANEALRQSGEIVQHNAVRGVAPGKHSLKQLVNAATTQKDALEEQFAAGRRNKSEAGAKYGW